MGFWSKLGKGLAIGGAGLGTVLTAGAAAPGLLGALGAGLGAAGKIAGGLGTAASGAAKGSADQRLAEGNQAVNYAQLANQSANNQFQADLNSATFQRGEQDRTKSNALLSALLGGLQDAKVTPGNPAIAAAMGTSTGGLRPSALLGNGNRESLLALLSSPGQGTIATPQYKAPTMPEMPTAGGLEKTLGYTGLGASLLEALKPLMEKKSVAVPESEQAPLTNPNLWGKVAF